MKNGLVTFVIFTTVFRLSAQETGLDVYGALTNPYTRTHSIITLDTLEKTKTLSDLDRWFRPSWVEKYNRVEFSSACSGELKKAIGKNDSLTDEQLNLLKAANMGCVVNVAVDYIPYNISTAKDNSPKKMNISLKMVPVFEAKYPGGVELMKTYLKENTIDKISKADFDQIKIATIKFNVNEQGEVTDAQISNTSENDATDALMLKAINNMPKWIPAENAKGEKIQQEFEFAMGTLLRYGCYRVD